jgi:hypothetical protein
MKLIVRRAWLLFTASLIVACSGSSDSGAGGGTEDSGVIADVGVGDASGCPSGLAARCGGACTDLNTDPKNCGACGKACAAKEACVAGGCRSLGCSTPADCDDGFSCTIDSCASGACGHTIGPSSGPTACPTGEFCLLGKGCVKGPACATTKDCADTDACTTNEFCDPTSSICTYTTLDKDGDGHPPPICGGDDCDDSDKTRYPGAPELCDGKDNRCDGKVDVGAVCPDAKNSCQAGKCACKPENVCTGGCFDLLSDTYHCGACTNICTTSPSTKCVSGACTCDAADKCGGACTTLKSDRVNCGACGVRCGASEFCVDGKCDCPDTLAWGTCSTPGLAYICKDPKNCGGCGIDCGVGACIKGVCSCTGPGFTTCGGSCVNTDSDPMNCGGCGKVCPLGCLSGKCTCRTKPNYMTCGGTTVDVSCDDANCGSCGAACPTGMYCDGVCH